ncbi:hypothetical protein JVU11DRAFT_2740 [Chiua virens]|nr:hypothetical protein JVU11DRAFT_2740 [Chiua virens]
MEQVDRDSNPITAGQLPPNPWRAQLYKPVCFSHTRFWDALFESSAFTHQLTQWLHTGNLVQCTTLATSSEFEGVEYKIIQPHRSQGDWTPPVTPALWGRLQGGHHQHRREEQWDGECKSEYDQKEQQTQRYESEQVTVQETVVEEKKEKHWYDVDDKQKKGLEIGGGILAGVAAIGAGYAAYKHHENKKEEKAAQAWSESNWFEESQTRTHQWRSGRHHEPVAWVWNEGTSIPRDAIQGGEERGEALYICRVYHEVCTLVGKASSVFKKGAVIGYKKDEYHYDKYEILVGSSRAVKWMNISGHFNVEALRARPVEGGREPDGTPVYIAQAPYHGAVHPGKASEAYGDGAFIPYDSTEKKVKVTFYPPIRRIRVLLVSTNLDRNTLYFAMPKSQKLATSNGSPFTIIM